MDEDRGENKEDRKVPWPYGPGIQPRRAKLAFPRWDIAEFRTPADAGLGSVLPLDYPLKSYLGSMQTRRLWSLANQGIKESPSHRGSSRNSVHLSGCPPCPAAPPCSCMLHPRPTGCKGRKLETQKNDPLSPNHPQLFPKPSSLLFVLPLSSS